MFVTNIHVTREGYFGYGKPDPTKPFKATVQVEGQHGKVELILAPDVSARLVALLADEIVAASKATAEMMTASVLEVAPTPALEAF